jgi:hypothetical protein
MILLLFQLLYWKQIIIILGILVSLDKSGENNKTLAEQI